MNYLNTIKLKDSPVVSVKILDWLVRKSEVLNLLIMPVSVACNHTDRKKIFIALKEEVKKELPKNSVDLSNIGSMVFFLEKGMAYGLSITFGLNDIPDKNRDSYSRRVAAFRQKMPSRMYGFGLPLLRMALAIYGVRDSLVNISRDGDVSGYTMIGFSKEKLLYSWGKDLFKVSLSQTYGEDDEVFLHVRKPLTILSPEERGAAFLFSSKQSGIVFYDSSEKKGIFKKMSKGDYKISLGSQIGNERIDEWADETYPKIMQTRHGNEIYWNGLLESLLTEAGVEFERALFNSCKDISIKKDFRLTGKAGKNIIGIDLSEISDASGECIYLNYAIDSDQADKHESIREIVNEGTLKINDSSGVSISMNEVPYTESMKGVDIVIGSMPSEDSRWRVAVSDDITDSYGRKRREGIRNSVTSTTQFIDIESIIGEKKPGKLNKKTGVKNIYDFNSNILSKSVIEVILKKWASKPVFSRKIEVDIPPIDKKRSFIAVSSLSWEIKGSDERKNKPFTFLAMLYQVDMVGSEMQFSNLDILSNFDFRKQDKHLTMLSYLQSNAKPKSIAIRLSSCLSYLDPCFSDQIDGSFKNSGSFHLFEIDDGAICGVWQLDQSQECLIPNMFFRPKAGYSIEQYIKSELKLGSFSRKNGISKIGENKKNTNKPEYQVSMCGGKLKIARKMLKENSSMDRFLLKTFTKVYTKGEGVNPKFTEDDATPIYAGLMSDILGAYPESGVKETVYEKISKLVTGD